MAEPGQPRDVLEDFFLYGSTVCVACYAWFYAPALCIAYLAFVLLYSFSVIRLQLPRTPVFASPLAMLNTFACFTIFLVQLGQVAGGQSPPKERLSLPGDADDGVPRLPTINDPQAKDAQQICPGYKASNVKTSNTGMTATLQLAGSHCQAYGNDVDTLSFSMSYQANDRINVKILPAHITDHNHTWFVLPEYISPIPATEPNSGNASMSNDMTFHWSNSPTFNFRVVRDSTGDTLFNTAGSKIIYEDQFIEFVTQMPADYNLYGLGETIHGFRLGNDFVKTMYAADIGDPIDGNIYGTHPVYIDTRYFEQQSDNTSKLVSINDIDSANNYTAYSHGLFNRNAHGQDILMNPSNITWRALGGSIDLYFYAGPDAKDVITSYQKSASGLPAQQQYWTLGYHQCRWGYSNWSRVEQVVDTFKQFEIPLETIWTDIDYMYQYRDFDNDPTRFNYTEGQVFLDKLHGDNQHYVPIVDAAIYVPNANNDTDTYEPFTRGNASNAFMLNPDGSLYIGNVWPGFTVFPDFLSGSGGNEWWAEEFATWHGNVNWDGIWLDMNEVSSFCVGSCGSLNLSLNPINPPFSLPGQPGQIPYGYPEGFENTNSSEAATAASASAKQDAANSATAAVADATSTTSYVRTTPTPGVRNINYPPYVINNDQGDLAVHAVATNATHHNGVKEYDFHNVWGHTEINATYNALLSIFPGKRPFLISRSTFVSSGRRTGHWGGDNASKFYYMYFSIPQALEFSIFGIPMFGVDTCGFQQNTDEELCNRWMQLSAFFPFYRNHNDISSIDQEPYVWESVAEATKIAMAIRFQLMPYLYTLMQNAHESGDTVMRALAWEYPNDPTLANADRQFFLGPAILVTPVLIEGADSVDGVFPGSGRGEIYYDWYNQTQVIAGRSENVTIPAPLGHIPVYVRGGYVIPMQQPAMTTTDGRKTPWSVLVPLGSAGKATGELYLDDGVSITPPSSRSVQLAASSSSLQASTTGQFTDSNVLSNVTVLGLQKAPGAIKFNGQAVKQHTYNSTSKVLVIQGLEQFTSSGAWTKGWKLTW